MKFAICNETFGDWPWEKGLRLARDVGYTGVEVAPFTLSTYVYDISPQVRRDYRKLVEDCGMKVVGLHWLLAKTQGFHLTTDDAAVRENTTAYFEQLIELCAELGGDVMVLGSPLQRNFPASMSHDQAMDNAAATLRPLVEKLKAYSVRIALEPLGPSEGNFLNRAEQACKLIKMLDSPFVKLHLDVKAMSSEPTSPADLIREYRNEMIHFHANDPNLLGPGMGDVDQRPIFRALRDIDYQGWVSVEVFDYSPGVENILRQSWDGMQNAIAAA